MLSKKSLKIVRSPNLIRKLAWQELHWEVKNAGQRIFLTFDDGPTPELGEEILDILKEFHARACFFCVGNNARKYPGIINRMLKEGHSIGNHTFSHLDGWKTPTEVYLKDIEKASEFLDTPLFRPPYGKISKEQATLVSLRYKIMLWSVLSWDFHPSTSPEDCFENMRLHTTSGSVIVMHDNLKAAENVRYALPRLLEHFTEKGYTFEALRPQHF